MKEREMLGSRLGFLLISAGCAIGLGNVWRFPYVTGAYGGALFVIMYLFFLLAMGLPILIMEFAVGRSSRLNMGKAFHVLEPRGTSWHRLGWISLVGSYILMMFYTTVTGWMLAYCWYMFSGDLIGLKPDQVEVFFKDMLSRPLEMGCWMTLTVITGFGVCAMGLQKGVERVVKPMMLGLLLLLLLLVVRAVTLPGAEAGISFYLAPDLNRFLKEGVGGVLNAAMNQAFFTLSIGVGSMCIFGSYLNRKNTLTGEAAYIVGLDTFVALMAGLVIFPVCFAFHIQPNAGPGLIFVTFPNIFSTMGGGHIWGTLFFIFMSFAAMSTVIGVFENIISYCMDVYSISRGRAVCYNMVCLWLLSIPCVLGFNLWSGFQPLGAGSCVLDLEDFIISNNLLPLGGLLFALFCCQKKGWGWDRFVNEVDQGAGVRFPRWLRGYLTYVLPILLLAVFVLGYIEKFGK